jgi:hypothetical protein
MSFRSWIDQQIEDAQQRGAFDDLPGAGKPLPNRGDEDAGQAWLRNYLSREGVSSDELLPTPLRLRKEAERLADTVQALRSEEQVRAVVAELNNRIAEWRRLPLGSPIFVPLVDEELMVGRWRRGQSSGAEPGPPPADAQPADARPADARPGAAQPADAAARRPRWWHRVISPRYDR